MQHEASDGAATDEAATTTPELLSAGPSRRRVVLSDVVRVAVAIIALWWFARIGGQVDWGAVREAVRDLAPLEIVALLAVVAIRQTLNAGPLAIFVPSLPLPPPWPTTSPPTSSPRSHHRRPMSCCASRCSAPGASALRRA